MTEKDALGKIDNLIRWTNSNKDEVSLNEYYRLANSTFFRVRKYVQRSAIRARENIPVNLRTLLRDIYKGHCQICDFWFINKRPCYH